MDELNNKILELENKHSVINAELNKAYKYLESYKKYTPSSDADKLKLEESIKLTNDYIDRATARLDEVTNELVKLNNKKKYLENSKNDGYSFSKVIARKFDDKIAELNKEKDNILRFTKVKQGTVLTGLYKEKLKKLDDKIIKFSERRDELVVLHMYDEMGIDIANKEELKKIYDRIIVNNKLSQQGSIIDRTVIGTINEADKVKYNLLDKQIKALKKFQDVSASTMVTFGEFNISK